MNNVQLIEELTGICVKQAEIIKAQAYVLEQFGAQVREEEARSVRERLKAIAGDWEV